MSAASTTILTASRNEPNPEQILIREFSPRYHHAAGRGASKHRYVCMALTRSALPGERGIIAERLRAGCLEALHFIDAADIAAPFAVIQIQQALGRYDAGTRDLVQWFKKQRLVVAA